MLPQRPHFRPLAIGLLLISSSIGLWLLSLTFFAHAMPVAHAQEDPTGDGTFVVQSLDDVPPTAEDPVCAVDCTLRDAVRAANAMTGANTIVFADGLAGEIVLTSALVILDDVTIDGPGSNVITVTIPGSSSNRRVFDVSNDTVTLRGMTLRRSGTGEGGGIRNAGNLTIEEVVITNSDLNAPGGAVFSSGALTVVNSILSDNRGLQGGGIYNTGSVVIIDSRISGSDARSIANEGTAIRNQSGEIIMMDSVISENLRGVTVANYDGQITLERTRIENNAGEGLRNEGITSTLVISDSVFLGNGGAGIVNGGFAGGGLRGGIVTVTASTFEGAAIRNRNDGSVTVVESLFTGRGDGIGATAIVNSSAEFAMLNTTVTENFLTGLTDEGAGIINNNGGTFLIEQSAISNNRADEDSEEVANDSDRCGGILNQGSSNPSHDPTTMTIRNSTISGNSALRGGGGLCLIANAPRRSLVNIYNSTIVNNRAVDPRDIEEGGGGIYLQNGDLILVNSILANNFQGEGNVLDNLLQHPDFPGTVTTQGVNLSDTQPAGFGTDDLVNVPPLLGPLADNGGATHTHALLAGSPALDAADDDLCPAIDQRGEPRPANGDDDPAAVCDIGAYEAQSVPEPDPDPEVENGIFLPFVLSDS